jgi:hypothetical protein
LEREGLKRQSRKRSMVPESKTLNRRAPSFPVIQKRHPVENYLPMFGNNIATRRLQPVTNHRSLEILA